MRLEERVVWDGPGWYAPRGTNERDGDGGTTSVTTYYKVSDDREAYRDGLGTPQYISRNPRNWKIEEWSKDSFAAVSTDTVDDEGDPHLWGKLSFSQYTTLENVAYTVVNIKVYPWTPNDIHNEILLHFLKMAAEMAEAKDSAESND